MLNAAIIRSLRTADQHRSTDNDGQHTLNLFVSDARVNNQTPESKEGNSGADPRHCTTGSCEQVAATAQ